MAAHIPKYCLHRATGQAYATDPRTRKPVYFGVHATPGSRRKYDHWIIDLLAWRRLNAVEMTARPTGRITIEDLLSRFLDHAAEYYRKHGVPTSEVGSFEQVLRRLLQLTPRGMLAKDYGALHLAQLRDRMAAEGLARKHINSQCNRVRRVWRWGVSQELVPVTTLETLRTVPGLAIGRSGAREEEPVEPVLLEVVETTLRFAAPRLAALVRFQLAAGCRPGEAVVARPCDIDQSTIPWRYVPHTHKTEHRGRQRTIYLGPRARAAIAPWLEAALRRAGPEAWIWPSSGRGSGHLSEGGLRQAIRRTLARANKEPAQGIGPPDRPVPHWCPAQLRHTAATAIRAAAGLEAAQVLLGHSELQTTQIYAAADVTRATAAAELLG